MSAPPIFSTATRRPFVAFGGVVVDVVDDGVLDDGAVVVVVDCEDWFGGVDDGVEGERRGAG